MDNPMTDLKPCPFCGDQPTLEESEWGHYVTCDCDVPYHSTEAEAIAAWNRRALQQGGDGNV